MELFKNRGSILGTNAYLRVGDWLVIYDGTNNTFNATLTASGDMVLCYGNPDQTPVLTQQYYSFINDAGPAHNVGRVSDPLQPAGYHAVMQGDGNFVLYHGQDPDHRGGPYWASNTNTSSPAPAYSAVLAVDGNLRVVALSLEEATYRLRNPGMLQPLWQTGLSFPSQRITTGNCLRTNQWLGNGSYLLSANAQYGAILQDDANLALTMTDPGPPATPDLHRPFWGITAQPGNYVPAGIRQLAHPVRAPFIVCMQDNGQLVISWGSYHPGSAAYPLWATPAGASGDYIAVLRDDGTLAVCAGTDPGTQASPLWESARDTDPNAIIMSITGGNHQSMTFSQAWTWQQFPQPLTVKLARQNGAPVIGQPVSFAIGGVTGEGGQAYGDQRLNSAGDTTGWCNTTTDGDGKASAIAWGSTWVQEDVGLLFSVSCDNQQTFQWFTLDMFLNSG